MSEKKLKVKVPEVEELLEAGVHFGHQARRWHPKMEGYIFSKRQEIHILDLYKSRDLLEAACKFLYDTAAAGGKIIFVGTKKQAKDIVELEAKRSGALFVSERWIGGTITNFHVIRQNIDKLKDFLRRKEEGDLARYTKKERLLIDREIDKLGKSVGGIMALNGKPDAIFIVDVRREKTALREAARQGVNVVALVDTNSDPTGVRFVIPGNDDAIRSIALILKTVADFVEAGYKEYAARLESEASGIEPKVGQKKEPEKEPDKKEVEGPARTKVKAEVPIDVGKASEEVKPQAKKRGRPKKESQTK